MHYSAKRGLATLRHPSVCPSVIKLPGGGGGVARAPPAPTFFSFKGSQPNRFGGLVRGAISC